MKRMVSILVLAYLLVPGCLDDSGEPEEAVPQDRQFWFINDMFCDVPFIDEELVNRTVGGGPGGSVPESFEFDVPEERHQLDMRVSFEDPASDWMIEVYGPNGSKVWVKDFKAIGDHRTHWWIDMPKPGTYDVDLRSIGTATPPRFTAATEHCPVPLWGTPEYEEYKNNTTAHMMNAEVSLPNGLHL